MEGISDFPIATAYGKQQGFARISSLLERYSYIKVDDHNYLNNYWQSDIHPVLSLWLWPREFSLRTFLYKALKLHAHSAVHLLVG